MLLHWNHLKKPIAKKFFLGFIHICLIRERKMKISAVRVNNSPQKYQNKKTIKNTYLENTTDQFIRTNHAGQCFNTINFMGKDVHILDGGEHACDMVHFANAISSDMDINLHKVETNFKEPSIKQFDSLLNELDSVSKLDKDCYIAIPCALFLSLQNLQDQVNFINGSNIKLTPNNVKAYKPEIMNMLKQVKDTPYKYAKEIGYMDSLNQGIKHTYDIINKLDKMAEEGYKIYIPSGHPEHQSLKWLSGEKNKKTELYHYISTGNDIDDSVKTMRNYIQNQGWYDFNILTLSNVHIVNLTNQDGNNFIYSAYDSCVTDRAPGVYNLSPVRQNGQVIGYSFTDQKSNQYPKSEFPNPDFIENISRFVGLKLSDLLATKSETEELKKNSSSKKFKDKLFKVEDVFTPYQIITNKLELKGKYTDSTKKLFFDTNKDGQVIFQNCNCEKSEKPSIKAMWGSCFAVFSAIKEDIEKNHPKEAPKYRNIQTNSQSKTEQQKNDKKNDYKIGLDVPSEVTKDEELNSLLKKAKIAETIGNFEEAEYLYNNIVNKLCKNIIFDLKINTDNGKNLKIIKDGYNKYNNAEKEMKKYKIACEKYNNLGFISKLLLPMPEEPTELSSKYYDKKIIYDYIIGLANLFNKLGDLCTKKGEYGPAGRVCYEANEHLIDCDDIAYKIISKRAQNNIYIGDIIC